LALETTSLLIIDCLQEERDVEDLEASCHQRWSRCDDILQRCIILPGFPAVTVAAMQNSANMGDISKYEQVCFSGIFVSGFSPGFPVSF